MTEEEFEGDLSSRPGTKKDGEKLMEIAPEIGERVRRFRVQKRMKQEELAEMLSTSKHSVSRLERGTIGPPLGRLARIADILNVPLDRLFREKKEEELVEAVLLFKKLLDQTSSKKWRGIIQVLQGLCRMEGVSVEPEDLMASTPEDEQPKRVRTTLEEMRERLRSGEYADKKDDDGEK